jgi:predicted TIM-barrel enzyme
VGCEPIDRFHEAFGTRKPVIAMKHLSALPGTPLRDAKRGVTAIVDAARADLDNPERSGVDAVMFGSGNDRPYELRVDTASTAAMAYSIGRPAAEIRRTFGVDVRWDPMTTMAKAAATGAVRAGDPHGALRFRHG